MPALIGFPSAFIVPPSLQGDLHSVELRQFSYCKALSKHRVSISVLCVNHSCPNPPYPHKLKVCVFFQEKQNVRNTEKKKKCYQLWIWVCLAEGEKIGEMEFHWWVWPGNPLFLVPWGVFQKWQSKFAQVLWKASKEADFPWLVQSF